MRTEDRETRRKLADMFQKAEKWQDVEKILQESRDHVQWDGEKFVPKPMQLSPINLAKFRDSPIVSGSRRSCPLHDRWTVGANQNDGTRRIDCHSNLVWRSAENGTQTERILFRQGIEEDGNRLLWFLSQSKWYGDVFFFQLSLFDLNHFCLQTKQKWIGSGSGLYLCYKLRSCRWTWPIDNQMWRKRKKQTKQDKLLQSKVAWCGESISSS